MIIKVITSNQGKFKEFREVLSNVGIEAEHCPVPYDEIQTADLEEVVRNGMKELRKKGLENFIIDDSGMFIEHFKGFPGVYSAYVQKTLGNDGVLKLLDNVKNRKAEFKCCIGCSVNGNEIVVTGTCKGTILFEARGTEGFGYDPIFSVDGKRSFAEMPSEEKNKVSHRGLATELLLRKLGK